MPGIFSQHPLMLFYQLAAGQQDQSAYDQAKAANEGKFDIGTQLQTDRMRGGMSIYDQGAQQAVDQMLAQQGWGNQFASGHATDMNRLANARTRGVLGSFDQNAANMQQGYGLGLNRFLGSLGAGSQGINQGYQQRYDRGMSMLDDYGRQMAADIDRGFANERGAVEQDLINRGLMSSTTGGKDILGVEERRSAEQRRLGEDLTRNRLNFHAGLSGDALGARERLLGQQAGYEFGGMNNAYQTQAALNQARANFDAALRGDQINTANQMGMWQQGLGDQYSNQLANFYMTNAANRAGMFDQGLQNMYRHFMDRVDEYPQPMDGVQRLMGMNAARPPEEPEWYEQYGPAIASGVGSILGGPIGGMIGNVAGSFFGGGGGGGGSAPQTAAPTPFSAMSTPTNVGWYSGAPNPGPLQPYGVY